MRADVTQFTTASLPPAGRSFHIATDQGQTPSLEFNHYAGMVGAALQQHGYVSAPADAKPDMMVTVHYGSRGNHTEIYGDPWGYGPGWGGGFGAWGGWGPGPWGWHHAAYGPTLDSQTYYSEMLEVQIFDGPAWRNNVRTMIYQGRAMGDATVNEISAAVPSLVQALFMHFPGNNGQTERVTVPYARNGSY